MSFKCRQDSLRVYFLLTLVSCTQGARFPIPRGIYVPSTAYMENVPHSGDIIQVECTDSGNVSLENATYSITGGNSQPFTIDSTSGQISWMGTQTLDYENTTFYLFNIMCVDNLNSTNTATAQVNVSVGPVNEFIPEISPSIIHVPGTRENTPQGTILVSTQPGGQRQYSVTDGDAGPDGVIIYTLTDTSDSLDGLFTVNPENGALMVARELDVDNVPSASALLIVRITVCDTDPPRDECPNLVVTIIVQAAADNDPMFSENLYTVALFEDTPRGSIIATSMCSDQDSGVGAYEGIDIVNVAPSSAEDSFLVNSSSAEGKSGSGDLILLEPLDFETARLYNITLRCYDNQLRPVQDTAKVVIIVRPVNDEPPVFEHIFYNFTVNRISASGVDIGQVIANDNDQEIGGEISYSILSGDMDNFGVRPDGMVYLKHFVFVVEGDSFDLAVMASDGEFNSTADVRITVSGLLSIPETAIVGSVLVTVLLCIAIFIMALCCCKSSLSSRSRKHNFNKVSPNNTQSVELDLCNNAIANPGYATIEDVLDKDAQGKLIQAESVRDGGAEKEKTKQETKPMEADTKQGDTQKESADSKGDASDLAMEGKSEEKPAPSIHVTEDIDWGTVPTLKESKGQSNKK